MSRLKQGLHASTCCLAVTRSGHSNQATSGALQEAASAPMGSDFGASLSEAASVQFSDHRAPLLRDKQEARNALGPMQSHQVSRLQFALVVVNVFC